MTGGGAFGFISSGMEPQGIVFLVGAGPGEYDLITAKGIRCLREADVVVYDYLVNKALLDLTKKGALKVYVGKKGGEKDSSHQKRINEIMAEHALAGKRVVRLKGGDPMVLGRGGEEALYLASRSIPFEIVPGVSSITAVPAYAGIPLTHRGKASAFAVATGHEDPEKEGSALPWEALAAVPTLVLLMSYANLEANMEKLIANGRSPDTPVAVISWGTLPRQRTVVGTVGDIARRVRASGIRPPCTVVVGEVVRLRKDLNWYETRPLFGHRVLVTRARSDAGRLAVLIEQLSGEAVVMPTIEIVPPPSWEELDAAIRNIETFDWIVFTSRNGVERFFERLRKLGKDARALGKARLAVIGEKTALALERERLRADLVPERFVAEGLVDKFQQIEMEGKRVLIARAARARELLPCRLRAMGAHVTVAPAYETRLPEEGEIERPLELLRSEKIDAVTFASSSAVRNFFRLIEGRASLPESTVLACIGPVTASTLKEYGREADIVATRHTMEDMVEELAAYMSRASGETHA